MMRVFLNSFRTSGRVFSTVLTTLVFFFLPSEVEEELNEEDEEVVFEKDWRNDIVLCSVFRLSRRVCTDNKRQTTVRKYCGNSRDRYDTGALQVIPAYNPPPGRATKRERERGPLCLRVLQ